MSGGVEGSSPLEVGPAAIRTVGEPGFARLGLVQICRTSMTMGRAFAGILTEGLAGASAEEVLAVPDDLHQRMGLAAAISPLRVRGGGAILARLKRQVREQIS